jgi:hypothetical protein
MTERAPPCRETASGLPLLPSRPVRFSPKVWPPDYSQDRKFRDY